MTRYEGNNVFGHGTVHHAAENGNTEELEKLVQAGVSNGYPALVTLQSRDEILECMPIHAAAEKGQDEAIKVRRLI
jgi:hypothetical protein